MNESEKLLKMKEKIDKAKADVFRLEGSRDQLYKTLKKDYECKTIEDAQKKLDTIEKQLDQKEAALEKGIASLEHDYDWG